MCFISTRSFRRRTHLNYYTYFCVYNFSPRLKFTVLNVVLPTPIPYLHIPNNENPGPSREFTRSQPNSNLLDFLSWLQDLPSSSVVHR